MNNQPASMSLEFFQSGLNFDQNIVPEQPGPEYFRIPEQLKRCRENF